MRMSWSSKPSTWSPSWWRTRQDHKWTQLRFTASSPLASDSVSTASSSRSPLRSRTPVFSGPVQTLAFLRRSCRSQRDLSAGTHTSLPSPVYHRTRPLNEQWRSLTQWPSAFRSMDHQVPRAPWPGRSVTSVGAMSCTALKGVTFSSLLLRAHSPARLPSAYLRLGFVWRIFAGLGLSDFPGPFIIGVRP